MAISAGNYRYGFLEQALAAGQCFINAPQNNPIAMIKLAGPAALIANAMISYIQLDSASAGPKFKCEVIANGVRLFAHEDFTANGNEYVDGTQADSNWFVHGFVKAGDCFLSYSVQLGENYQSPPVEAASAEAIYVLSPFALEPYVGDVDLTIKNSAEANRLNYDVETISNRVVNFVEGFNYELNTTATTEVPNFVFSSVAGGGIGKELCPPPQTAPVTGEVSAPYLASINGIKPNEKGELILSTDPNSCISINAVQSENKLQLDAHCAPCCRCSDYADVQKYIRSYAMIYVNLVKKFNELVALYNTTNQAFKSQIECCESFDKVNPRIRVWPQQNFKVLVQALAENNKKRRVCLCDVDLAVTVKNKNLITATEDIENIDGTTTPVVHTLPANKELIIAPLKEGAYVYFKSKNPNNAVDLATPDTGKLTVSSKISALAIPEPCDDSGPTPSNCMDPCSGYFMITSGFSILDPTFRKIANIKNEEIPIDISIVFRYKGTVDNPCSSCTWQSIYDKTKIVKIPPNRRSTNPCAPVKLKDITSITPQDPTAPIQYFANFPEQVTVKTPGSSITVTRKAFNGTTGEYDLIGDPSVIEVNPGNYTAIQIPDPLAGSIPPNALGLIMTVTANGTNMVTLCKPNPDANVTVEIPVAPSSIGVSFTL